jgi:hypothetical protein
MSNNKLNVPNSVAIVGAFGFILVVKFLKEITKNMFQPKQDNIFKQRREKQARNKKY